MDEPEELRILKHFHSSNERLQREKEPEASWGGDGEALSSNPHNWKEMTRAKHSSGGYLGPSKVWPLLSFPIWLLILEPLCKIYWSNIWCCLKFPQTHHSLSHLLLFSPTASFTSSVPKTSLPSTPHVPGSKLSVHIYPSSFGYTQFGVDQEWLLSKILLYAPYTRMIYFLLYTVDFPQCTFIIDFCILTFL